VQWRFGLTKFQDGAAMTVLIDKQQHAWRGATLALSTGLAFSLASIAGLLMDQLSLHGLADHVSAQYSPYGQDPDPNILFAYLYMTAGLGVVGWLIALRGARSQKPWAPVLAGMTFVVGALLAAFNLVITEHGTQVFRCCGASWDWFPPSRGW